MTSTETQTNAQKIVCLEPTQAQRDRWDTFVLSQGGHIFQRFEWGQLARNLGWEPNYWIWETEGGQWLAVALVLERSRLLGQLKMLYVPRGPVVPRDIQEVWPTVLAGLADRAFKRNALVMRINPPCRFDANLENAMGQCHWVRAKSREMHVRTFRLPLPSDEKTLWSMLEYRTQKAIKRATGAGVQVRKEDGSDALSEFLSLYKGTARRLGITSHQDEFIRAVYNEFHEKGWAHLFLARIKGVAVSGMLLFRYGDTMEEMWLGWDSSARDHKPNQLLHWEILRWCLRHGVRVYDFGGVPPDAQPNTGVYFYKSGFGAECVDLIGEYDFFPTGWGKFLFNTVRPPALKIRRALWK